MNSIFSMLYSDVMKWNTSWMKKELSSDISKALNTVERFESEFSEITQRFHTMLADGKDLENTLRSCGVEVSTLSDLFFGGLNFRWTKSFSGRNFRQQARFSASLSALILTDEAKITEKQTHSLHRSKITNGIKPKLFPNKSNNSEMILPLDFLLI